VPFPELYTQECLLFWGSTIARPDRRSSLAGFEQLASSLLASSATAFAGHAANQLLEENPETSRRFSPDAFSSWQALLSMRSHELAVAVEFSQPELFASAVDWARASFAARDVPEKDLKTSLQCLQDVLSEELPESVRHTVTSYFELALGNFEKPIAKYESLDPADPNQRMALSYLEKCLQGQPRIAIKEVLDAVDGGLDIVTAYTEVIAHAQREVGRLWHAAKIGVHEEHLVTSTTFSLLTLLAHRFPPKQDIPKTVVGAALGDDAHEVGVRMIMDLFTISGWRSISLGARLPGTDLALAVRDFEADLLVLSVTLLTHLIPVREAIREARRQSPDIKVLVGGLAVGAAPELWRRLGADGYVQDGREATSAGARLIGLV
jgi:methanogenic corrinoid protein MtbC1